MLELEARDIGMVRVECKQKSRSHFPFISHHSVAYALSDGVTLARDRCLYSGNVHPKIGYT